MLWVVQDNFFKEVGYAKFVDALARFECNTIFVKPVPFTNILLPHDFDSATMDVEDAVDPITDDTQPIIIFGSTTLSRIAQARGWSPGSFVNDNFHYSKWVEGFGTENLLNADSKIGPVKSFYGYQPTNSVFVRPTEDTKSLSGTVMSPHDFTDWISQISTFEQEEFAPLHQNTEIVISSVKEIYNECRVFVVNGWVVTASMYKTGNRVIYNANVDRRFTDFAEAMCQRWQPADGFVIDIADTPNGLKVIEVNNLNSSGFYEADVYKLINALNNMKYTTKREGILI